MPCDDITGGADIELGDDGDIFQEDLPDLQRYRTSGYTHGVLVPTGGGLGPHRLTQKDPLLTCPGTRNFKNKMQPCLCPGEGLVPASVHGLGRHWRETKAAI